jgi:hypothetical protein
MEGLTACFLILTMTGFLSFEVSALFTVAASMTLPFVVEPGGGAAVLMS